MTMDVTAAAPGGARPLPKPGSSSDFTGAGW